jgi:hypothetical protein
MKYDYHTDAAVGACPGCGKALVLYNHVQLLPGEAKHKLQVLDSIFCLECVERMDKPDVGQTFLSANRGRQECLPHRAH